MIGYTLIVVLMLAVDCTCLEVLRETHFKIDHETGKIKVKASKTSAKIVIAPDNVDVVLKPGSKDDDKKEKTKESLKKQNSEARENVLKEEDPAIQNDDSASGQPEQASSRPVGSSKTSSTSKDAQGSNTMAPFDKASPEFIKALSDIKALVKSVLKLKESKKLPAKSLTRSEERKEMEVKEGVASLGNPNMTRANALAEGAHMGQENNTVAAVTLSMLDVRPKVFRSVPRRKTFAKPASKLSHSQELSGKPSTQTVENEVSELIKNFSSNANSGYRQKVSANGQPEATRDYLVNNSITATSDVTRKGGNNIKLQNQSKVFNVFDGQKKLIRQDLQPQKEKLSVQVLKNRIEPGEQESSEVLSMEAKDLLQTIKEGGKSDEELWVYASRAKDILKSLVSGKDDFNSPPGQQYEPVQDNDGLGLSQVDVATPRGESLVQSSPLLKQGGTDLIDHDESQVQRMLNGSVMETPLLEQNEIFSSQAESQGAHQILLDEPHKSAEEIANDHTMHSPEPMSPGVTKRNDTEEDVYASIDNNLTRNITFQEISQKTVNSSSDAESEDGSKNKQRLKNSSALQGFSDNHSHSVPLQESSGKEHRRHKQLLVRKPVLSLKKSTRNITDNSESANDGTKLVHYRHDKEIAGEYSEKEGLEWNHYRHDTSQQLADENLPSSQGHHKNMGVQNIDGQGRTSDAKESHSMHLSRFVSDPIEVKHENLKHKTHAKNRQSNKIVIDSLSKEQHRPDSWFVPGNWDSKSGRYIDHGAMYRKPHGYRQVSKISTRENTSAREIELPKGSKDRGEPDQSIRLENSSEVDVNQVDINAAATIQALERAKAAADDAVTKLAHFKSSKNLEPTEKTDPDDSKSPQQTGPTIRYGSASQESRHDIDISSADLSDVATISRSKANLETFDSIKKLDSNSLGPENLTDMVTIESTGNTPAKIVGNFTSDMDTNLTLQVRVTNFHIKDSRINPESFEGNSTKSGTLDGLTNPNTKTMINSSAATLEVNTTGIGQNTTKSFANSTMSSPYNETLTTATNATKNVELQRSRNLFGSPDELRKESNFSQMITEKGKELSTLVRPDEISRLDIKNGSSAPENIAPMKSDGLQTLLPGKQPLSCDEQRNDAEEILHILNELSGKEGAAMSDTNDADSTAGIGGSSLHGEPFDAGGFRVLYQTAGSAGVLGKAKFKWKREVSCEQTLSSISRNTDVNVTAVFSAKADESALHQGPLTNETSNLAHSNSSVANTSLANSVHNVSGYVASTLQDSSALFKAIQSNNTLPKFNVSSPLVTSSASTTPQIPVAGLNQEIVADHQKDPTIPSTAPIDFRTKPETVDSQLDDEVSKSMEELEALVKAYQPTKDGDPSSYQELAQHDSERIESNGSNLHNSTASRASEPSFPTDLQLENVSKKEVVLQLEKPFPKPVETVDALRRNSTHENVDLEEVYAMKNLQELLETGPTELERASSRVYNANIKNDEFPMDSELVTEQGKAALIGSAGLIPTKSSKELIALEDSKSLKANGSKDLVSMRNALIDLVEDAPAPVSHMERHAQTMEYANDTSRYKIEKPQKPDHLNNSMIVSDGNTISLASNAIRSEMIDSNSEVLAAIKPALPGTRATLRQETGEAAILPVTRSQASIAKGEPITWFETQDNPKDAKEIGSPNQNNGTISEKDSTRRQRATLPPSRVPALAQSQGQSKHLLSYFHKKPAHSKLEKAFFTKRLREEKWGTDSDKANTNKNQAQPKGLPKTLTFTKKRPVNVPSSLPNSPTTVNAFLDDSLVERLQHALVHAETVMPRRNKTDDYDPYSSFKRTRVPA